MKAIWNNAVIVESNDIVNIEGNNYFPLEAVKKEYLKVNDKFSQVNIKQFYQVKKN